jgi:hypothetical protein
MAARDLRAGGPAFFRRKAMFLSLRHGTAAILI